MNQHEYALNGTTQQDTIQQYSVVHWQRQDKILPLTQAI